MGRSYLAARSRFAFRQLPGILQSSLWGALSDSAAAPSRAAALITDLGNDLVFGSSPEDVVASAEECLTRLRSWNAEASIVLTRPPVESVQRLGALRFRFFRRALFPGCRLSLPQITSRTIELDERLVELATRFEVPLFCPDASWYGLDPIHLRRRHQLQAFAAMMDHWKLAVPSHTSALSRTRYQRPTAEVRWVFGRVKQTQQPVFRSGQTTVYAY